MSYTPPTGNDIEAAFSGVPYTPPTGNAIAASFVPLTTTVHNVSLVASLPGLSINALARYDSNVQRPLTSQVETKWQVGTKRESEAVASHRVAADMPIQNDVRWQVAARLESELVVPMDNDSVVIRNDLVGRYQLAKALSSSIDIAMQMASASIRPELRSSYQLARELSSPTLLSKWEAPHRRGNHAVSRWQIARALANGFGSTNQRSVKINNGIDSRYQIAKRPDIGRSVAVPPVIPFDPCYIPPPGDQVHLLFEAPWSGSTNLLFICDLHPVDPPPTGETVVVPIRRVYVTFNSASLTRVDGGIPIPTYSMTLGLDVDSWTWSFSAAVPGRALPDLQPVGGEPVEVQAMINGVPYRFLVEGIGRDREFGRSSLRISGRGKAALLDKPYAPVLNFGNGDDRTAQQMIDDILTINGVPMGWDVTFGPDDWLVPANTWSHQGTYISAINSIAEATGAYVQPHNTDEALSVLLRYPVPAWEWGDVTPDYELPGALMTREGITWANKPIYDRVYVSGQRNGVLGRYTRAGTAGDMLAPPVVDPLITGAIPVRQRGRAILSDTGRIATVQLRMPVLALTGIIKPGKFVEYVDEGVTRIGLTRGVSVDVGMPLIHQTLTVETHE